MCTKGDRGPEPEPELEPGGAAENGCECGSRVLKFGRRKRTRYRYQLPCRLLYVGFLLLKFSLRIAPDRGVGGCRNEVTGEEETKGEGGRGRGEGKRAVGNSSQRDLEGENQGDTEAAKWTGGADTTPVTGNSWGGMGWPKRIRGEKRKSQRLPRPLKALVMAVESSEIWIMGACGWAGSQLGIQI